LHKVWLNTGEETAFAWAIGMSCLASAKTPPVHMTGVMYVGKI